MVNECDSSLSVSCLSFASSILHAAWIQWMLPTTSRCTTRESHQITTWWNLCQQGLLTSEARPCKLLTLSRFEQLNLMKKWFHSLDFFWQVSYSCYSTPKFASSHLIGLHLCYKTCLWLRADIVRCDNRFSRVLSLSWRQLPSKCIR